MRSTTSASGRVVVLAPDTALGLQQCRALRAALRACVPGPQLVVVDLLEVEDIDDCIVDVLVGAAGRCASLGITFVVANAQRQPWLALTRARVAGVVRAHRHGTEPLAELVDLLTL